MPRTYGKGKQTRLSFAPLSSSPPGTDRSTRSQNDRLATLRYDHPSLPSLRRNPLQRGKTLTRREESSTPPKKVLSEVTPSSEPEQTPQRPREDDSPTRSTAKDAITVDESSDSTQEIQRSARKYMRLRSGKRKRSPSLSKSSKTSANERQVLVSDESDEDMVIQPRRRLRRGAADARPIVVEEDSEDSDEPIRSSPMKRRKRNINSDAPETPRRNSDQERLDLEEDLEVLQDSVVKNTRTRGRLANSARAQQQRHLEALRRRRAGGKEEDEAALEPDSDAEHPDEADPDDEPESEAGSQVHQRQFRRQEESDVESSIAEDEDLDQYEDDFVLEDDNAELGVPSSLEDLPFEFSRHAYKQLKEYFQDAVEWMVNNKINPAFPRSDPLYEVAFMKLEDEVKGRTGSQLVSSVWNVKFRRALLARPHVETTLYPITDNHPCDACNRSKHPASFDMKLYGKAYSLETLEPLSDDDSDEDDEEEGPERDRDGYSLPEEDTRFYLGRHCKNKASLAHTLTHWRFHLNEWVVDYLERMGYLEDDKVLERSHWSHKQRARYASEVMGSMVDSGEVKKLWRDFHITLKSARETTVC
ncbi:hypothetical protein CNMCM6936_002747 [Aspergillus lentulus]|uniref:DUF4211 domain-containing protein n=1 Tax=Aspergillus lentulus TaxID=293939 RepID=A0AAN5YTL2_ASPLE|nr:hypothetical protein CNMCM6069_003766 [Aspergillus lentulus]KAF4168291.1 hypothetical protein CNMCM6936_002747 [Aspergillus lentulus]KAF4178836.1 hypothetical protein CNMCM8060_003945 [Aspergillus lentulus]KAF4187469.1 hypothetical protein CNMCM7927_003942 [Aspergillus lentulus]KAF4196618.1 hypothetical protein CNMCM8694_004566 [Aspergillus lentulus]